MKVFISWSGDTSRAVATTLRHWLPDVIQAIEPWLSAEDIDKGTRWAGEMAKQLEEANAGVTCLTRENLSEPWIHFEAGALSKVVDSSYVCVYLLDLSPSDVTGPLSHFQLTSAVEEDTLRLVKTLNKALGNAALKDDAIDRGFKRCWPDLERDLDEIRKRQSTVAAPHRDTREILDEILSHVRGLSRAQQSPPTPTTASVDLKPRDLEPSALEMQPKSASPVATEDVTK